MGDFKGFGKFGKFGEVGRGSKGFGGFKKGKGRSVEGKGGRGAERGVLREREKWTAMEGEGVLRLGGGKKRSVCFTYYGIILCGFSFNSLYSCLW